MLRAQIITDSSSLDIIRFKNGDVLQGKLKQIQRGELNFDPDIVSDIITAKLKDIEYIRAMRKVYLVETVYNQRYYGLIDYGKAPGWVRIYQATDTVDLFIQDLDNIQNLDDDFWKRLDGNVSLGFSYSRNSNIGRINANHRITYSTKKWIFVNNGDLMYTIDKDFRGIEKADFTLQAYREFWKKWFVISSFQFQRSTELGVRARFQLAEAIGPIIIKNRMHDFRAATGISAQNEFSADSSTNNSSLSLEIPLLVNYYLFKLGTPELKLQATNTLFYSLSQSGRWRIDQNIVLYWKVISHLNINIQVYFDFDSKPPSDVSQKVDYGAVFSVGYSW